MFNRQPFNRGKFNVPSAAISSNSGIALLQEVKAYLKITWEDENAHLQNIINRGKARLNELAGAELDFDTPGLAQDLLLDYCRYSYNNASEYFEENFREEILRLQLMTGVALLPKGPAEDDVDDQE